MVSAVREPQDGTMTDNSSTSTPGAPYGGPGPTGKAGSTGGAAFFDWMRGLGFVRGRDRWLAGVCGAIAARTGLDPIVIRGIAIVIAILGGPVFFLYAVGWALIPDESGRSLAEQAARQVFEPAMIVVGALLLFTFVPWMQGIWWQGPPEVWGMPGWLEVLLRTGWAIGLTAAIIVLVIYIAKRVPSPRSRTGSGYGSPGATKAPGAGYGSAGAPTAQSTPYVPPVPPVPGRPGEAYAAGAGQSATGASSTGAPSTGATDTGSSATGLPASGARQSSFAPSGTSLWDDLTGKPLTEKSASAGWSAPYGDSRTAGATPPFDPESYRAIRRAKHLGAGFISVVAGLALSAGALTASLVADGSWSARAFLVGASAALAVVALGIVVAGIRGKEGGWLNFFSIVLAASLVWTAVVPTGADVASFGDPTWRYDASGNGSTGFAMIAGAPVIDLTDVDNYPSGADHTIDVWTAFGEAELLLPQNRTVVVQTGTLAGAVDYSVVDGTERGGVLFHDARTVARGSGTGVTTVRVWLLAGQVTATRPALR